jgi:hypothetical protein
MGISRKALYLVVSAALLAPGFVLATGSPVHAAPVSAAAYNPPLAWSIGIGNWNQTSSPTIADVNGDGTNDVVFGAQDGIVRVVNQNGTSLPGWPQKTFMGGSSPTAIDGSIAVADLDRNGQQELVVPTGSLSVRNQHGGVIVFNRNGSVRCRVNTADVYNEWTGGGRDGYREAVHSAVAIGDVNADGYPDLVFGSYDHRLYAVDRSCHMIPGFPVDLRDTLWPTPALYDMNGDGRAEIFMGVDRTPGPGQPVSGGSLVALSPYAGGVRTMWVRDFNETIWSSPAIGDIDADGRVDVVFGTGMFYKRSDTAKVFALHIDNGSNVAGWPITQGGLTYPSVALGDVSGDGRSDVVVGSWNGTVGAYRGHGERLWSKYLGHGGSVGSPIIADMNGDGRNDVGVGNVGSFRILNGANGADIAAVNGGEAYWGAGAVGKFGSQWKLITAGFRTGTYHDSRIQAHNILTPGKTPPWPMFHKNAGHTGAPLPTDVCRPPSNPTAHPSSASANGYWVLSSVGGVYGLGAPFYGSVTGSGSTVSIRSSAKDGYYILTAGGAIVPRGSARSYGSMVGKALKGRIIGMAPTKSGHGYWLLGSDGGIFSFGDARFFGSTGALKLKAPIIAMAATTTGNGYWLLGSDGGVFTFGDARYKGSTGAMRLGAPIISMAAAPSGAGYWLVARDGGVFSFGVPFYGSAPGMGLCTTPSGMQIRPTYSGHGYYVVAANGRVLTFGDAKGFGNAPGLGRSLANIAVDLTLRKF